MGAEIRDDSAKVSTDCLLVWLFPDKRWTDAVDCAEQAVTLRVPATTDCEWCWRTIFTGVRLKFSLTSPSLLLRTRDPSGGNTTSLMSPSLISHPS